MRRQDPPAPTLSVRQREHLARHLLAQVDPEAHHEAEAGEVLAGSDQAPSLTADDAHHLLEEIEANRQIRLLYDEFRTYVEASRKVSCSLAELDRNLVELARLSEKYRPDASDDIALFHAAIERAQGDSSRSGIALPIPASARYTERAFVAYLMRAFPEPTEED